MPFGRFSQNFYLSHTSPKFRNFALQKPFPLKTHTNLGPSAAEMRSWIGQNSCIANFKFGVKAVPHQPMWRAVASARVARPLTRTQLLPRWPYNAAQLEWWKDAGEPVLRKYYERSAVCCFRYVMSAITFLSKLFFLKLFTAYGSLAVSIYVASKGC